VVYFLASKKGSVFDYLEDSVKNILKDFDFKNPTVTQINAIKPILDGKNVLLMAPTGSGKTEATLLPMISNLLKKRQKKGISVLYITPLRALNRDMFKRLLNWATKLNITVEIRHGDTTTAERRRQSIKPPDILITTPETLQAILPGKRMKRHLRSVRWVVIDEIHGLVDNKRGIQLCVALERLRDIVGEEFQRVALSATIGCPEEVGKFLVGERRDAEIIQINVPKNYSYYVERPYPTEEDYELAHALYTSPEAAARISRIKELVENHTSTLIFVNSRQNAEMLGRRYNLLDRIGVHHGSLSKEERQRIEDELKKGQIPGIICTSTLELGIDIGSIDIVIQYLSPRQVTNLIQRVGRSGHQIDRTSKGIIITAYSEDSLESITAINMANEGILEKVKIHENALDVLAHQIAGLALDYDEINLEQAYNIVKRSYPYRNLLWETFIEVINYLEYLGEIRIQEEYLRRKRRTRQYYYENLSMIPDEKRYPIIDISTDRMIGTLGEEFIIFNARIGLTFICKGSVWKIKEISEDGTVYVVPNQDPTAAIPGWDGEMIPIPYKIAQEMGKNRREICNTLRNKETTSTIDIFMKKFHSERYAIRRIVEEIKEQMESGVSVPCDNTIIVEGYNNFIVIHSCFGETVNRTLGIILSHQISKDGKIVFWWADGYRILFEFPSNVSKIELEEIVKKLLTSKNEVENLFIDSIKIRFPFSNILKHVAERFGAIKRGIILGYERLDYLAYRFHDTPIYQETLRQVLIEKVDLNQMKKVFQNIEDKKIKIETIHSIDKPTAFGYRILKKFLSVPEMISPDSMKKDVLDNMKKVIMTTIVQLLCISCGEWSSHRQVKSLSNPIECNQCGSGLVAVFRQENPYLTKSVNKRIKGENLSDEEIKNLSETRRNADLILSHGKRGVIALLTRGIGPQTASRIVSKMHYSEEDFYKDLLDAKLTYLRTRQYWD
jgi:ATP-dependent Lhr-like helicase